MVASVRPKIIWLDVGNAGTRAIADLLSSQRERIDAFEAATDVSLLILSIAENAV